MLERERYHNPIIQETRDLVSEVIDDRYTIEEQDKFVQFYGYTIDRHIASQFLIDSQNSTFIASIIGDLINWGDEGRVMAKYEEGPNSPPCYLIQIQLDAHGDAKQRYAYPEIDFFIHELAIENNASALLRTYYKDPLREAGAVEETTATDHDIERFSRLLRYTHEPFQE